MARLMVERGWNVIAGDQRGHGRSSGVPTHVDDFQQYVQDLEAICDHFQCDPERTALLGYSMGGLISIRFAQMTSRRIKALILLSPLLGVKVQIPWFLQAVAKTVGRAVIAIAPHLRFRAGIDASETTRCPVALEQKRKDDLNQTSFTAGWYMAMQKALKGAWKDTKKLELPLVVIQAHQDKVVDPASPERWVASVRSDDKGIRYIPEALHDLFSEPDWNQIATYIAKWLDERLPPTLPDDEAAALKLDSPISMSESFMTGTITPPNWQRTFNPLAEPKVVR